MFDKVLCISFLPFPVSLLYYSLNSLSLDHRPNKLFALESLTWNLLLWEYIYRSSQFQWMLLLLLSDILGLLFFNFFIFSWVTFNDYLPFSSYYSVLLFLCLYCSFQGTSLGLLSILDWKCLNKLLLQIFFLTVCFWGILLPTTIFSTFTLVDHHFHYLTYLLFECFKPNIPSYLISFIV